jgi:hypothetical protein
MLGMLGVLPGENLVNRFGVAASLAVRPFSAGPGTLVEAGLFGSGLDCTPLMLSFVNLSRMLWVALSVIFLLGVLVLLISRLDCL